MNVADASDIRIYLPISISGGTPGEATPVVHITEGSLFFESTTIPVVKDDSGIWEEDVIVKQRWGITGTSHHTYSPGHSFSTLLALWKSRQNVPVKFKIKDTGGEEYTGNVKILSLRTSGNSGQNMALSFSLKGQGAPN